jgi:hypothetical protein
MMVSFTCKYFYDFPVLPVYVFLMLYLVICMHLSVPLSVLFGHFSGYFPIPYRLFLEIISIYPKLHWFCMLLYDLSDIYLNKTRFAMTTWFLKYLTIVLQCLQYQIHPVLVCALPTNQESTTQWELWQYLAAITVFDAILTSISQFAMHLG